MGLRGLLLELLLLLGYQLAPDRHLDLGYWTLTEHSRRKQMRAAVVCPFPQLTFIELGSCPSIAYLILGLDIAQPDNSH